MRNLKKVLPKWYSKLILVCTIFLLLGSYIVLINIISIKTTKCLKLERLTTQYQLEVDRINNRNDSLLIVDSILCTQIDSIRHNKEIIIIKYDKKVKSINDNNASEHIMWLDSTIKSLNYLKK